MNARRGAIPHIPGSPWSLRSFQAFTRTRVSAGWERDFYLVNTSLEYFPGVPLFHSTDLVRWRQIGHCLTRRSQLDLAGVRPSRGIFAPTLRHHRGVFYLVTTNVGKIGNFLVTATDPRGPWSEPLLIDDGWFDPSLFFDDDGTAYYTRRGDRGIVQSVIDVTTGRLQSPPRMIVDRYICTDIEGPHLYKIRGWYFLMAAEGGSRFGHAEVIGRSRSPWGPFEPCPANPLFTRRDRGHGLIRDVGHGDLVDDTQGNWWMVLHGTRNLHYNSFSILGRETFLSAGDLDSRRLARWSTKILRPGAPSRTRPESVVRSAAGRTTSNSRSLPTSGTFCGIPAPTHGHFPSARVSSGSRGPPSGLTTWLRRRSSDGGRSISR